MTIKDIKKSLVVFLAIFGLFSGADALALTYTRDVDVQFTFASNLSVSIDSADIEILDLTPGQQKDSNVINISVSTNSIAGYTVSATTGNSSTYNTTNMVHTNGTNTFTSLAENASESTLSTDNTWGYAVSPEVESWTTFSGLPIYTDTAKEIAKTDGPSTDITKFKIHAKAAADQPAGDYRNVINFTVVANTPPKTLDDAIVLYYPNPPTDPETNLHTMQAVNEDVCDLVDAIDEQTRLTDIRDHKSYWVAKLKDGRCWMTQNLDFDLDSTKTYTTETTDLGWDGVRYASTSWQPTRSTMESSNVRSDGNIDNWNVDANGPVSFDPGDWYWYMNGGWYSETNHYLNGDVGNPPKFSTTPFSGNGEHGHVGNYYNYPAATANNSYNTSDYGAQSSSVCPKNWGLPPVTNAGMTMNNLATYYGNSTLTDEYLAASPTFLVRGGLMSSKYLPAESKIVGTIDDEGYNGYYWYNVRTTMQDGSNGISMMQASAYQAASVRCTVHTANMLTINFNANNGDGVMTAQEIKYGVTKPLIKNNFTRSGYIFNGWNTVNNGSGTGYGDKENYTATLDTSVTSITLYAQWVEDTGQGGGQGGGSGSLGKTLQDAYEQAYVNNPGQFPKDGGGTKHGLYVPHKNTQGQYDGTYFEATQQSDYDGIPAKDLRFAMQDIDLEINGVKVCDYATVIGSEAYVLDLRDHKSYWIAKLADGKCWMTQNLDHNIVTTPGYYTPDNTDITANWTPVRGTTSVANDGTFSWAYDHTSPYSLDVGNWYWTDTWYDSNSGCPADNTWGNANACNYLDGNANGKFKTTAYYGNGEHGHVGNFYNWSAAVAINDTSEYWTSVSPDTSICPQGWKLPVNVDTQPLITNDFRYLLNKYNAIVTSGNERDRTMTAAPLYFIRAGEIITNSSQGVSILGYAGYEGDYWSVTSYGQGGDDSFGAMLFHRSSSVYLEAYGGKGGGMNVRCLAR